MDESFDMKDLGRAKKVLGREITHDKKNRRLWLSQERYVERILKRFNMKEAKLVTTPEVMPFNGRRKQEKGYHSIFINCRKSHVCYGMYKARHCSCSRGSEQISSKSWQRALGSSKVGFQMSEGNFQTLFKFWKRKTSS